MSDTLLALIALLQAHAWEALILWLTAGLLSLVLAKRSQIDAWAEAHPRLAGALKLLRSLGLDPWMFVQAVALIVKGRLPPKLQAAKIVAAQGKPISDAVHEEVMLQSVRPPRVLTPVPPSDRAASSRSVPPPPFTAAVVLIGALALARLVTACSGTPEPAPCDPASLAAITASCSSFEDCSAKLDERQAHCTKVIEESP